MRFKTLMKFECIVKRNEVVQKIIRYFSDIEYAFAWLELEGYKVLSIKHLKENLLT